MAKFFKFNITIEPDKLVAKAKKAAEESGVTFSGDSKKGCFRGSGIAGDYSLEGETAIVTITQKPFLASWSLIETKVKEFFL
jgi:hypothetical protein